MADYKRGLIKSIDAKFTKMHFLHCAYINLPIERKNIEAYGSNVFSLVQEGESRILSLKNKLTNLSVQMTVTLIKKSYQ